MRFDAILVGAGLQNVLVALAVLDRDPQARIAIVERETRLAPHTWSFHGGDLTPLMLDLIAPAVVRRWPGYRVRFPNAERRIDRPYASISSERLEAVLNERLARAPRVRRFRGIAAAEVNRDRVVLASGERLIGSFVVDARGPDASQTRTGAYQKFLGAELELSSPLNLDLPWVMDARVDQIDGFRFFYVLPLAADRLLVEDTYYSERPELDEPALLKRIVDHAQSLGARVRGAGRIERGVLPLPLSFDWTPSLAPLRAGYAGGWFHPTTGYSLPAAARLAQAIAEAWPFFPSPEVLEELIALHRQQARFFTLLNQLMFRAYDGPQRWRSLERFYRLPVPTVERFYAMRTTMLDRARILWGRPPRGTRVWKALEQFAAFGG